MPKSPVEMSLIIEILGALRKKAMVSLPSSISSTSGIYSIFKTYSILILVYYFDLPLFTQS